MISFPMHVAAFFRGMFGKKKIRHIVVIILHFFQLEIKT